MQNKFVLMFLGLVVLLAISGAYFFYHAISKDYTTEEPEISVNNPISTLPEKNSNTRVTSNSNGSSTTSSNSNGSSSHTSSTKNTKNQGVVDQTLKRNSTSIENGTVENKNKIILTKQEQLCLTIGLFDSDADRVISNYEIVLKYKLNFDSFKTEKLKSDGQGNCQIFVNESGPINFQIFTKDYGIHSAYLVLHRGINDYKANLIKGGSLEIHAINPENKIVENLTLKIINGSTYLPKDAFVFDATKENYLLSNMPLGLTNISFKAPGYQETSEFLVRIDSKEVAVLEVILQPAKMIYFNLNVSPKPDLIFISESYEIKEDDNQNGGKTESFKNKEGLFEYSLENLGIKNLFVFVDGYLPECVNLTPENDTYQLNLKLANSATIQIFNEKNEPVQGAKVVYFPLMAISHGTKPANINADNIKFFPHTESNKEGIVILSPLGEKMFMGLNISHKDYVNFREDWSFDAKTQNTKKIILKEGNGIAGKVKNKGPALGV